jgi:lipoprotein-anchoring transpeptidase ErfK/SrfK
MISAFSLPRTTFLLGSAFVLALAVPAHGQNDEHWRKTKKLAPAGRITVTVEKAANGKPISNAAVIFRASKNGKDEGSLEVKTNPDGEAKIDIIEIGSHVTVQIIADGFSTGATEFDLPGEEKNVLVKMEKPRAQVSAYQDNDGKPSSRPPGIQEPRPIAPKKVTPPPTPPATTTPPASSPQ